MSWHELPGPLQHPSEPAALDDWFAELLSRCAAGSFEAAVGSFAVLSLAALLRQISPGKAWMQAMVVLRSRPATPHGDMLRRRTDLITGVPQRRCNHLLVRRCLSGTTPSTRDKESNV